MLGLITSSWVILAASGGVPVVLAALVWLAGKGGGRGGGRK